MIITRLSGGLGNQMFQYAVGRALALKNNTELGLDIRPLEQKTKSNTTKRSFVLDFFKINIQIVTPRQIPLLHRGSHLFMLRLADAVIGRLHIKKGIEKSFCFDSTILSLGPNTYLSGYWQSYKYFAEYKDTVRADLQFKQIPSNAPRELYENMNTQQSVCIHVRRGDYVGNSYYVQLSSQYYEAALAKVSEKVTINQVYVFSDDPHWCKENLKFSFSVNYVPEEYGGIDGLGHFWLMQQCRHFIIANSSFSWWAAWLSSSAEMAGQEKIVIAPKRWFSDESIDTSTLIPPEWIII